MPEDYEHNNDSLFGAFIRDFTAPQSSVFSASTIIIPNLSVMNWLKDKIAQNLSICANIKFLTLNQYINNLYLANNSNVELLNFKDMKFIIYDYLSRCDLDRIEFLPIREYILSNTNESHVLEFEKTLFVSHGYQNLEPFFEKVYYSCRMNQRKPNADIFESVLNENNLIAEETLFIDDSPQHVEGALTLGIKAMLLEKNNEVEDLLKELKLI